MHVHRLRQKIDQGFECPLIHTVLGAGYTIREPKEAIVSEATASGAPTNVHPRS